MTTQARPPTWKQDIDAIVAEHVARYPNADQTNLQRVEIYRFIDELLELGSTDARYRLRRRAGNATTILNEKTP